jgi:hypothetical protein
MLDDSHIRAKDRRGMNCDGDLILPFAMGISGKPAPQGVARRVREHLFRRPLQGTPRHMSRCEGAAWRLTGAPPGPGQQGGDAS